MQPYELIVVLAGTVSEAELPEALSRVEQIVEGAGGTELRREEHGKQHLAYAINGQHYGHFATIYFTGEATTVATIQQKLRLSKDVIRFVVEDYVPARHKRKAQIATTPLVRGDKEKEREERSFRESASPIFTGTSSEIQAPVAAPVQEEIKEAITEEAKSIDLEEIDRKLDELLQGDLAPKV